MLSSGFRFYSHNGDDKLGAKLGLNAPATWVKGEGGWLHLGTVTAEQVYGEPAEEGYDFSVEVEVYSAPAQFWRFTVKRTHAECVDDDSERGYHYVYTPEEFVLSTGSGGFGRYWEMALAVAQNCLDIDVVERVPR